MIFNNKSDLILYLNKEYVVSLGNGSQGRCYYDRKNKICFKILEQFFDDDMEFYINYSEDEFTRFSGIKNNTYIFSDNVIFVNDLVVGYTMRYSSGKMICDMNPLLINLDKFGSYIDVVYNDNVILADNGICSYDVLYNIMYGKNGFNIIDTMEYSFGNKCFDDIKRNNDDNFNYGVMMFLIDGYFDEFISDYGDLKDMYLSSGVDIRDFINLFRKYLGEYVGSDITKLCNANKCLNKRIYKGNYIRSYR